MDQIFTDKIKGIEAEITATDAKLQAALANIETMRPELTDLESELRKAKRTHAIEGTTASQKAVGDAKRKLDSLAGSFDDTEILSEALTERIGQLAQELSSAKLASTSDECVRLAAKAPGLAEQYDKSIRAAFNAAFRLKLLRQMVASRNGTLNVGDTYGIFDQVYQGFPLIGSNGGDICKLRESCIKEAEIEKTMAELLTV